MKKLYKFLSILGLSLFMTSCYYDAYIEIPNIDNGGGVDPVGVSFATDVEPLFARCVGCHGGNTNPDLRTGNAYAALVPAYVIAGDADNSSLYKKLPGVGHPLDVGFTLNANEIAVIKAWINEGAKNN
jgi:hypothetical protein